MKKRIVAFLLAAGLLGAAASSGRAHARDKGEERRNERRGITLEFWGGYTGLAPHDLNLRSDFERAYVDYFFNQKFDFLAGWRSGYYSYIQTAGSVIRFDPITGTTPVGFRAKLILNRVFSLSLGLAFLSRAVTAYYSAGYAITDMDPDNVEFNGSCRQVIDFPQWRLAVRAWTPLAAVHARTRLARRIQLEGYAGAGIVFARCSSTREYTLKTTDPDGFWELNRDLEEMQGSGRGVAVEVGAQAGFPLNARMGVFIEGGYAYRMASNMTGRYSYLQRHEDANSEPHETRWAWEDAIWRVNNGTYDNPWGRWNASWPTMADPAQLGNSGPFHLDLSGFQVRIGLAWHL